MPACLEEESWLKEFSIHGKISAKTGVRVRKARDENHSGDITIKYHT